MKRLLLILLCTISTGSFAQNAQWITAPFFRCIGNFNQGVATIQDGEKWGYIDQQGKLITSCNFDVVYPFSDGMGVATDKEGRLVAIVDKNGNKITQFRDKSGKQINLRVDSRFACFSDSRLLVTNDETQLIYGKLYKKWGYIDKTGQLKTDIKYFGALPFSDGKAGVMLNDFNYFYISPDEEVLITSDLNSGKNAIGAMGFNNGKALIVDEKGIARIDNSGRRTSDKLPKFTPLQNYYDITTSKLPGKEGELLFDNKGRIYAFVDKNNLSTEFLPQEPKLSSDRYFIMDGQRVDKQANWQSQDIAIVKASEDLYGIIQVIDSPTISLSLPNDNLESVFGNTVTTSIVATNNTNSIITNIEVKCANNVWVQSIDGNASADMALPIKKQTDAAQDIETIKVQATRYGLLLAESTLRLTINDKPSLRIAVRPETITVDGVPSTYRLTVVVGNDADEKLDGATLSLNNRTREISMDSKSESTFHYELPLNETRVTIGVKPPKSPATTYSPKISIRREEGTQSTSNGLSGIKTEQQENRKSKTIINIQK